MSFIIQLTRYTSHRMAVRILLEITLSEIYLVVKTVLLRETKIQKVRNPYV